MTFHLIDALKSFAFIGMAFIATYICIPKAIKFWTLWKETKNPTDLSAAITYAIAAFFLLSANFLIFMRAVGGGDV